MQTYTPATPESRLIDIGVNLTDHCFQNDWQDVVEEAHQAGITPLILTGTNLPESQQCLEYCTQSHYKLFATAGIHPHSAKDFNSASRQQLSELLKQEHVVAVGETGLDFNRNFSTPEQQIYAFEQQLELAVETQLPLFLHERDAHQQQLQMLKSCRADFSDAVAHCFTGTREELYNYLDLDLHIGITGWVCDERRGSHLRELIKEIPPNRLMIETDAPYLLPRDIRPKPKSRRNKPYYLQHILQVMAELTDKPAAILAEQTRLTSQNFFRLS